MTDVDPHRAHVFIDESKSRNYYIAAEATIPAAASEMDRVIRQLARPGQRLIRFKTERDSSRRSILAALASLDISVHVYDAKGLPDKAARPLLLPALVSDLASSDATRLMIERDESPSSKRIVNTPPRADLLVGVC